jgi:small subunit ribosomal protein S6
MPLYENIYIARQDATTAQVEALTETFAGIIAEQGGKVTKKEYWGLRSLAYRIKKNRKGHYTLLNIDAPPAAVTEMERNMRISEDVLRLLTVRIDELEEGPSAMLQSRSRDDRDRPRRGDRDDRDRDRDRPRRERTEGFVAPAGEGERS